MESKRKWKFSKRALFFLFYLFGLFLLSLALDQFLISQFSVKQYNDGLIFKPFTRVQFQTIEYQYQVYVNQFGFRDVSKLRKLPYAPIRIMTIGDSFTYGWGVEIDQSWPKILEKLLNEQGLKVEVDNLGKPGAGPKEYAEIAEKAIPVLKPDLVIVGMLQGDDLAQAKLNQTESPELESESQPKTWRHFLAGLIRRIYPYSSSLITKKMSPVITSERIHQAWRVQAEQTYLRFSPAQKVWFNFLDEEIKRLFFIGEFNPAVIHIAITNPDYFFELEDLESAKTREHIQAMADCLARIKMVADHYNAKMMVVSVPHRIYVSEPDFNTPKRFGFKLDEKMLISNSMDRAIEMACQKNNLKFFKFTVEFRQATKNSRLFFALDGHLNPLGHEFFAQLLAPIVQLEIKK